MTETVELGIEAASLEVKDQWSTEAGWRQPPPEK